MRFWVPYLIAIVFVTGCSEGMQDTKSFVAEMPDHEVGKFEAGNLTGDISDTEFAKLVRSSVVASPSARAGLAGIAASQARITSEQGRLRPQLNAETSVTDDGDTIPILRLSQIIYDGGKVASRVGLRRIEAQQKWLDELSVLNALSFEAVETIIDLERNRRLETQAQENLQRTGDLVDDLRERFDAGAGSVADLLAGEGRQSNAETELAQAQTEVALATATWIEVFGSPPGLVPTIPPAPNLVQASAQEMVARSPQLRSQRAASEFRRQEVVVAERATRPTLSAILETDFDRGSIDDGAQARLGVDIPIYQGGSARADVRTARANLQQSKANEEALRRELLRNLTQAIEETTSVQQRLAFARRAAAINSDALDAARGQFDIGRTNLLQILDALRELNTAQVRVIQLEAQARRAEYAVLAVTGDILDALGVERPAGPVE